MDSLPVSRRYQKLWPFSSTLQASPPPVSKRTCMYSELCTGYARKQPGVRDMFLKQEWLKPNLEICRDQLRSRVSLDELVE